MFKIILALVIIIYFYLHFKKSRVIEIIPTIEKMINTEYRINNKIYNLKKIN